MSDRYSGFIVTLSDDIKDEDARPILDAIRMVKGVLSVEPVVSSGIDQHIAEQRVRLELLGAIRELILDGPRGKG